MKPSIRSAVAALLASATLSFPILAVPAAAAPPTVYAFADSLVDAGNLFIATGGAFPNPAQGYFNGRFTNGHDFTDYLQLDFTGAPTASSLTGGNNYGWTRSRDRARLWRASGARPS